jgi:hypothetical protein
LAPVGVPAACSSNAAAIKCARIIIRGNQIIGGLFEHFKNTVAGLFYRKLFQNALRRLTLPHPGFTLSAENYEPTSRFTR